MKIPSNFLTCWDLKQKSMRIRLAVCQYRPSFQAPPVLGKLNWQFSILSRSEGHMADSRKKQKRTNKKTHRSDKQGMESEARAFRGVGQQLLQVEAPRGHLVQPPASGKDRLRGVRTAVKFSCVYRSQGESCP